jgi:hypothetical protein
MQCNRYVCRALDRASRRRAGGMRGEKIVTSPMPHIFAKYHDTMRVEIESIGVLSNPVVTARL